MGVREENSEEDEVEEVQPRRKEEEAEVEVAAGVEEVVLDAEDEDEDDEVEDDDEDDEVEALVDVDDEVADDVVDALDEVDDDDDEILVDDDAAAVELALVDVLADVTALLALLDDDVATTAGAAELTVGRALVVGRALHWTARRLTDPGAWPSPRRFSNALSWPAARLLASGEGRRPVPTTADAGGATAAEAARRARAEWCLRDQCLGGEPCDDAEEREVRARTERRAEAAGWTSILGWGAVGEGWEGRGRREKGRLAERCLFCVWEGGWIPDPREKGEGEGRGQTRRRTRRTKGGAPARQNTSHAAIASSYKLDRL